MGYNWVPKYGGAITWLATGRPEAAITIQGNSKLHHNVASNNGGAIYATSNITITSAEIYGNRALGSHFTVEDGLYSTGCGGGIYLYPYTGPATTCVGTPLTCHLSSSVSIHDNYAHDRGGGVYLDLIASNYTGFYHADTPNHDEGDNDHFTICDVLIQGPVYGNEAAQGGGVCIMDFLPNRHFNTLTSTGETPKNYWSKEYRRVIDLSGAIYNNKATAQSIDAHHNPYDKFYGGGVYIYKGPRLKLKTNNSSTNTPHVIGPEWEDGGVIGSGFNFKYDYEKGGGAGTSTITINGEVYGNSAKSSSNGFGGGICIVDAFPSNIRSTCDVTVNGSAEVYRNECDSCGGGIYLSGGRFTMTGGAIGKAPTGETSNANKASADGGGFYITGGTCTVSGGSIAYNEATRDGGGFYVNPGSGTTTYINSSTATTNINNNKAHDGAGAYVASGNLAIAMAATSILDNEAKDDGGGIYVDQTGNDRTVVYSGANIEDNKAQEDGGGLYVKRGKVDINESMNILCDFETGDLSQLMWTNDVTYPWHITNDSHSSGSYCMRGGARGESYDGIPGYDTHGLNPHFHSDISTGAYFEQAGTISFKACIKSEANWDFGYFYIDDVQKFGISGNGNWTSYSYNVSAGYHTFRWRYEKDWRSSGNGDSFYVDDIQFTITTNTVVDITGNQSTRMAGGGLYAQGGNVNATRANISSNEAATEGGGIYASGGTVNVKNSTINNNYAAEKGGGLYIPSGGTLNLMGTTTLSGNHVPQLGLGGGVYLGGTVQAGNVSTDVITVADNYAGSSSSLNNIYLPNPNHTSTTPDTWPDVITVVNNGLNLSSSSIGFSVPHNFVPVIYCQTASYLSNFMTSNAIFEDSGRYTKYYANNPPSYYPTFIYLSANTWVQAVTSQPSGFSASNIDSEEDLAWVISMVNGLNGVTATQAATNATQTYTLTADLDMKDHSWVPIGFTGKSFNGTFNGNGHTVSNIYCSYLGEGNNGTGRGLGMFGTVENATIHDLFLHSVELEVQNQTGSDAYVMGAIANEAKGSTSIYNCTADATMESTMANTTMGGLVGTLTSGTIHSSAAMPNMTGYTMGGLVGNNSSNIYNSFANPEFTHSGSGTEYVGGLAAVNTGHIENCYVRLERPQSLGSARFGMLAGSNSRTNTIVKCYGPDGDATQFNHSYTYLYNGATTGLSDCDLYKKVIAPYLYNRTGDNAVGASGTLLGLLNSWVDNHSGYAPWKRTTAGGYVTNNGASTGGNINGDYPIHQHADYKCAASTNGINLDYAANLDYMLATRHTTNATVNLYDHDNTSEGTGTDVMVYIDENTSLLQSDDTKDITSYTCQIIPGDQRSWHFVSSSLEESYIGFSYGQDAAFNWDPNPCLVTVSTDDENALFPSDLPMTTGGYSDVSRFDLYCFYEPEYHWINLKRNDNSHWHMNAHDVPIDYPNESYLTPGKGYLISLDQDQMLQNKGTLNNGTVEVDLDYTPTNAWAGLLGYNLIGNPYQSYLDFTRFASTNSSLWYDNTKGHVEPTYAIYDPSMGGYIQYKEGASRGAKTAPSKLNMHQGFMVRVNNASTTKAYFYNNMRTNDGTGVTFRDEQPAYPLINLTVTDDEGVNDFAVLELGRGSDEGAEKLRANDSKGWLYLHHNNGDYAILFRTEVDGYQPLWFEASEAGTYTLSWETANGTFDQLTLIDNITGVATDMLSHDSYVFEANPDQYKSRFKIVVGDWKGVEENNGASTGSDTFAFVNNGNLVVNGEGTLQLFDVTGRCIYSKTLSGSQTMTTLPEVTAGVYVLRLSNNNGTRTQKIVLE